MEISGIFVAEELACLFKLYFGGDRFFGMSRELSELLEAKEELLGVEEEPEDWCREGLGEGAGGSSTTELGLDFFSKTLVRKERKEGEGAGLEIFAAEEDFFLVSLYFGGDRFLGMSKELSEELLEAK